MRQLTACAELEKTSKDLCVDAFDPQNHSLASPFYEVFSNLLKMRDQDQGGDDAGWFCRILRGRLLG